MTLGADVVAVLPQLRAEAESLMVSTCTIGRYTETTDPDTLETVRTVTETHYTGKCRLRFPGATVSDRDVAGQALSEQSAVLSIPVGDDGVLTGDLVIITSNPYDPDLVGAELRVTGVLSQSLSTARRFPVERLS